MDNIVYAKNNTDEIIEMGNLCFRPGEILCIYKNRSIFSNPVNFDLLFGASVLYVPLTFFDMYGNLAHPENLQLLGERSPVEYAYDVCVDLLQHIQGAFNLGTLNKNGTETTACYFRMEHFINALSSGFLGIAHGYLYDLVCNGTDIGISTKYIKVIDDMFVSALEPGGE